MTNDKIKAPAHAPWSFSLPLQVIHAGFSSLSKILVIMVPKYPFISLFCMNLPVRNIFKSFEFCHKEIDNYIKPTVIKKKKINLKIIISRSYVVN